MLENTVKTLLGARDDEGVWVGRLSSSPLATAVGVYALHCADADAHHNLIQCGLKWLVAHQQADGSWGDAEALDPGNLSTTLLCYAAFFGIDKEGHLPALMKAEEWIVRQTGGMEGAQIAQAVYDIYGKDRTFAVPILTMCALTGVLDDEGFSHVKALPFELSVLPRSLFRMLKLTVVSYALPALIAIGQVKFHFNKPANPFARLVRYLVKKPSLRLLEKLQPSNGGFLEATPLTSFVTMSLASMGLKNHSVVKKAVEFIVQSARTDGSWPIDTNLSTWVTSLSVSALMEYDEAALSPAEKKTITDWYLDQQYTDEHVFTAAAPGGW
ncbi:MAG: prenyltransferase/squalene oxidase repeat-containing protein, partial [Planctomycetota bacterium]